MKILSLEGLTYLYQKLKDKFDSLSSISHTHENKDVLDGITKNLWAKVEDQTHSHNNISLLNSISPADITTIRETFPSQIYELQQSFGSMQSAITVYVNSESGSDDNDGNTADTAFATLGKALSAVSYYKSTTINLAAGTYTIPNKDITWICSYISLIGNSASDTVIKGNISLDNSYLKLSDVTLDCTDAEYANTSATAPLRALSGSKLYLENATVSTVMQYCISATTSSNVYCFKAAFAGCTSYAVLLTGDASATMYRCTDESGKGLQSSYGCRAYLAGCTDFNYKNGYYGLVYVDGQQVLPQTAETAAVLSMGGNV